MSEPDQLFQTSFDLLAKNGAIYTDLAVDQLGSARLPEADSLPPGEQTAGYAIYVFTKTGARRGAERCYYIVYQPSLWDHYTVQRQWGMAGSQRQQFYTEHFRSSRPALARIRRLIEHRLRSGYRLSYAA